MTMIPGKNGAAEHEHPVRTDLTASLTICTKAVQVREKVIGHLGHLNLSAPGGFQHFALDESIVRMQMP